MVPIIIEGPDGAGKTTIVNELIKYCDYNIIKMTALGNQTFKNYFQKISCDNVFIDRCWISEQIYSKYFNRKMRLSNDRCELLTKLCNENNIPIIIMLPELNIIKKRLGIRGDEFEDIVAGNNSIKIYKDYEKWIKNHLNYNNIFVCRLSNKKDTINYFKHILIRIGGEWNETKN